MASIAAIVSSEWDHQGLTRFQPDRRGAPTRPARATALPPGQVPPTPDDPITAPPLCLKTAPGALPPALAVPQADPTFWVSKDVAGFLHAIAMRSLKGEIVNVLLVGPTGTGKSSLPKEFAAAWSRPFLTMHCQMITEQGDWWGNKELSVDRGTYFEKAALMDAVETPGCVILLDEANRTHPQNLNALFGFLDHRRKAWIPAINREAAVAPGIVFFITLNEGIDYVGTNALDRALRDRISNTIRLGYLPDRIEVDILVGRTGIDRTTACKLEEFACHARRNPKLEAAVSTRQLLECAALVRQGLDIENAVLFAIVNGVGEEAERKALLQSLQMAKTVQEAYAYRRRDDDE